eukprot:scaffold19798_cov142-Skeletonema_dohrnii-CCMP3373.AAC.2
MAIGVHAFRTTAYVLLVDAERSNTNVWSPAGGWWPTPVAWKRNTTICAFSICVVSSLIFKISAEKERRPIAPFKHIPSQRWCKHAKEDDPSLP